MNKKRLNFAAVPLALGVLLTGALTAPASAAVTTVCTGITGCKIVASSDIDGDKKADQVGIVYKRDTTTNDGRWLIAVRVKTASRTMQTTGRERRLVLGASLRRDRVDGRAGNEMVWRRDPTGSHTTGRVVTYRDRKLRDAQAPHSERSPAVTVGNPGFGYAQSRLTHAALCHRSSVAMVGHQLRGERTGRTYRREVDLPLGRPGNGQACPPRSSATQHPTPAHNSRRVAHQRPPSWLLNFANELATLTRQVPTNP